MGEPCQLMLADRCSYQGNICQWYDETEMNHREKKQNKRGG